MQVQIFWRCSLHRQSRRTGVCVQAQVSTPCCAMLYWAGLYCAVLCCANGLTQDSAVADTSGGWKQALPRCCPAQAEAAAPDPPVFMCSEPRLSLRLSSAAKRRLASDTSSTPSWQTSLELILCHQDWMISKLWKRGSSEKCCWTFCWGFWTLILIPGGHPVRRCSTLSSLRPPSQVSMHIRDSYV